MLSKIKNIIISQLNLSSDTQISSDTTFDQMSVDSIDAVDIIMAIEDEFEIEIPDEVAESFKSVGDILNYLKSLDLE